MTQQERITSYTEGKVIHNKSRGRKEVAVFKFMGKMYSTNNYRQNKYSFDDIGWEIVKVSWRYKFGQVYMGKVKKLRDCKKSLKAGVK